MNIIIDWKMQGKTSIKYEQSRPVKKNSTTYSQTYERV